MDRNFARAIGYGVVVSILCTSTDAFRPLISVKLGLNADINLYGLIRGNLTAVYWFVSWLVFYSGYLYDELCGKDRARTSPCECIGWMLFMLQAMSVDDLFLSGWFGLAGIIFVSIPAIPDRWNVYGWKRNHIIFLSRSLLWLLENLLFIVAIVCLLAGCPVGALCISYFALCLFSYEKFLRRIPCLRHNAIDGIAFLRCSSSIYTCVSALPFVKIVMLFITLCVVSILMPVLIFAHLVCLFVKWCASKGASV